MHERKYYPFMPFVTKYHPALPNLKNILIWKWHLIQNQPYLRNILKEPPLVSYRKGKSLKDTQVRKKYKGFKTNLFGNCRSRAGRSTLLNSVHFQVFSILFQNNFRYLVSHILRFWGILVSWGQNSGYIGIPLPPLAGPDFSTLLYLLVQVW